MVPGICSRDVPERRYEYIRNQRTWKPPSAASKILESARDSYDKDSRTTIEGHLQIYVFRCLLPIRMQTEFGCKRNIGYAILALHQNHRRARSGNSSV